MNIVMNLLNQNVVEVMVLTGLEKEMVIFI